MIFVILLVSIYAPAFVGAYMYGYRHLPNQGMTSEGYCLYVVAFWLIMPLVFLIRDCSGERL